MSAPPGKRPHEEGGNGSGNHGHSSISKYPPDDLGAYAASGTKLTPSAPTDYPPPHEAGQDSRMPKIPRTESHDPDRRSPLGPMFRVPSSSNDVHSDQPAGSGSRGSRDGIRDLKVESRDSKMRSADSHQVVNVEKDVKFDGRDHDGKETSPITNTPAEPKSDVKPAKEGCGSASIQVNQKDAMEQLHGKRYPNASVGNVDPWHAARTIPQGLVEVEKQGLNAEDKDYRESCEAVGENKFDLKADDKVKDKDWKRKEGKLREGGERDRERNECRNSLPHVGSSYEKGLIKQERDADRCDRERKDISKDKGKLKEREKVPMKKEAWNGVEKEGPHDEKGTVDLFGSTVERDALLLEQKRQKDLESWNNVDTDGKERKREIDGEVDGERPDKHRCDDKESDEGMDAEGGTERVKEGVQQRKRMSRQRGSPHANRDSRKPCSQENDVPQGKSDASGIVYRVGQCVQELIKLWKEYELSQDDRETGSPENGPTLEIRIPVEHVSTSNRQVRGGQLWGTDVYTNDSDLVAGKKFLVKVLQSGISNTAFPQSEFTIEQCSSVLMHTGYFRPTASPPSSSIEELCATIRVLPPQDTYVSTLRNNVRSRSWGSAIGCSLRVERCCMLKKDGGGIIDLKPSLAQSSSLEPTLAPVAAERTMTTRAAASNALRQQKFVREVTIQFSLSQEPWLKYSLSVIGDKGLKKPSFTSSRLKKGEVLYLETHSKRYELCFTEEKMVKASQALETDSDRSQRLNSHLSSSESKTVDGENVVIDLFRWSRCKKFLTEMRVRALGLPLPLEHVEVLEDNLEWDDILWSQTGAVVAGKQYNLARAHFLSKH